MKRNKVYPVMYQLPANYEQMTVLGKGGFGEVLKCIKVDTKETVAVKVPYRDCSLTDEFMILSYFKRMNLDNCNIIRFIDSFVLKDHGRVLVFEMLEMTLKQYLIEQRNFNPLYFHEVRNIIQQMANALDALKAVKVIHADIKMDNIMVVNSKAQPLKVKLIDFGLALRTGRAKQGGIHQATHYRAPEIILGLPFSEAIDVWSLGIVMGYIALGDGLFLGYSEYDTMRCIVELLGAPPDNLLCAGKYSKKYFVQDSHGHWRLKTRYEYWGQFVPFSDFRAYLYRNLDEVENLNLVNMEMVDADEKKMCINLLKGMLLLDGNLRVTPSEILNHPFITWGTLQHRSYHETLKSSISQAAEPGTSKGTQPGTSQASEAGTPQRTEETSQTAKQGISQAVEKSKVNDSMSGFTGSTSPALPPGVILVQSAPPECCLRWDEESGQLIEACPLDYLSENTPAESPSSLQRELALPSFIPAECNIYQGDTEHSAITSDDKESQLNRSKTKKCLKRCCSWMKRTSCCGS